MVERHGSVTAAASGTALTGRREFVAMSLGAVVAGPASAAAAGVRQASAKRAFPEHVADLGETKLNYAVAGDQTKPALLLIPGQTESWWGYEEAMKLLAPDYHVYSVDLRGSGRSSRTPGRYTLDNIGNDLVRFIALVVGRAVVVSGNSSGGVLSAWLSAFAMPGQIRGALYEDPPLFASEVRPRYGHSIRQGRGPLFKLMSDFLGDQWKIGNWSGFRAAVAASKDPIVRSARFPAEPSENMIDYDPEWARAAWDGTVSQSCPHDLMLSQVKTPVLLTQHYSKVDPSSGDLLGAISDLQVSKVREIVSATGSPITVRTFPDAAHAMHREDAPLFASVLKAWERTLPS